MCLPSQPEAAVCQTLLLLLLLLYQRQEAQREADLEPLLSSFLHATILEHGTFQESVAFVLANRLATTTLLPAQLYNLFCRWVGARVDVGLT